MRLPIRRSSRVLIWALVLSGGLARAQEERPGLLPREGDASTLVDRVVAQVENEAILLSDVQAAVRFRLLQQGQQSAGFTEALMQDALRTLIDQKVLLAQALADSVEVEESELDQVIETRKEEMVTQFGSEAAAEEALGYSLRDLAKIHRHEIRKDMLAERIRTLKFQNLKITRREVEEFFRTHRDSLPESPEMYKLRHILRKVPPGEAGYATAEQAIRQIQERLDAGEDFAELARDFSEDPGSAKMGGDLGFFGRGEMVPEFEAVAFRMPPGERSGIVRSSFGFHIIEVQEREGERVRARHILRSARATDDDKRLVVEFLLGLKERVEAGESFADLAQESSEDPEGAPEGGDLGWFSRKDLAVPQFLEALENLQQGEISEPFETGFGFHIIWLEARRESHTLSLEDDYQNIEAMALSRKQFTELNSWMDAIRKQFYIEFKGEL